jgi:Cu(I)/Ag(I) efflux system membrane fusion protein
VLVVPSEAVIETGTRRVVMVSEGDGRFRPVNVETGAQGGGQTEIRSGLTAGQRVVVSGQFLIDSEASLKATEVRLK